MDRPTVSSTRLGFAVLLAFLALLGNVCEFSDDDHAFAAATAAESTHAPEARHQAADHTAWCDETAVVTSAGHVTTPAVALLLPSLALMPDLIVRGWAPTGGQAVGPLRRAPLFLLHAALLI